MGLGGGRKVSRRGLIIIAALLFGIALSSRHTVDQNQTRSIAQQPNILAMLSKKPTSGQLRRSMARNTASSSSGIVVAARNNAVAGKDLAVPSPVSIVHRAGAVHSDETWAAAKTYIIDSEVTVLSGVTLTIQPGTVIKIVGPGGGFHVQTGGSLIINGTDEDPVYITSYRNDVVGGNTSTGMIRAAAGDYLAALTLDGGSQAVLANTRISYAEVGIVVSGSLKADGLAIGRTNNALTSYGGETRIARGLFSNNSTTMLVRGGDVIVRGVVKGYSQQTIQACNWTDNVCTVDAAYVTWQDGDAQNVDLACGRVFIDAATLSRARNCANADGFSDLAMVAASLQSRIDTIAGNCAATGQDPCEALSSAASALDAAIATLPSSTAVVPQSAISNRIPDWAAELDSNARDYIASRVGRDAEEFSFRGALRQASDVLYAARGLLDSAAR